MRGLRPISYSLLVAFCYRHLPPPDRNGLARQITDSAPASRGDTAAALQSSQEWGSGRQGEYEIMTHLLKARPHGDCTGVAWVRCGGQASGDAVWRTPHVAVSVRPDES